MTVCAACNGPLGTGVFINGMCICEACAAHVLLSEARAEIATLTEENERQREIIDLRNTQLDAAKIVIKGVKVPYEAAIARAETAEAKLKRVELLLDHMCHSWNIHPDFLKELLAELDEVGTQ